MVAFQIDLAFEDDDADEGATTLGQRHNFPPSKPVADILNGWSASIGASIGTRSAGISFKARTAVSDIYTFASHMFTQKSAKNARMLLDKSAGVAVGEETPQALVHAVLASVPLALPSVGASYGTTVFSQVGPTVTEGTADAVRAGDVIQCFGAELRGKKGLAPYHATFGTSHAPTVAIVVEHETKKQKLRVVLQGGHEGKKKGPEEVSLRLDDLKSGVVKAFRVPPRDGWIEEW